MNMARIPQDAVGEPVFLAKEYEEGDKVELQIVTDELRVTSIDNRNLYSIRCDNGGGAKWFTLNKTNMKALTDALGDDTTNWVGATFSALVVGVNKPRTNERVMSFRILTASIKRPSQQQKLKK